MRQCIGEITKQKCKAETDFPEQRPKKQIVFEEQLIFHVSMVRFIFFSIIFIKKTGWVSSEFRVNIAKFHKQTISVISAASNFASVFQPPAVNHGKTESTLATNKVTVFAVFQKSVEESGAGKILSKRWSTRKVRLKTGKNHLEVCGWWKMRNCRRNISMKVHWRFADIFLLFSVIIHNVFNKLFVHCIIKIKIFRNRMNSTVLRHKSNAPLTGEQIGRHTRSHFRRCSEIIWNIALHTSFFTSSRRSLNFCKELDLHLEFRDTITLEHNSTLQRFDFVNFSRPFSNFRPSYSWTFCNSPWA